MTNIDEGFDKTKARNRTMQEHPEYFKGLRQSIEINPDMLRNIIRDYGRFSQSDLAEANGLTYAQINTIIKELKNAGLLMVSKNNFKGSVKTAIDELRKEYERK